ncbi:MAG: DUF4340 domain-containing protein [Myxococcota bacterium]
MTPTPKTLALLALTLVLAAFTAVGARVETVESLPSLGVVAPADVARLQISTPIQKMTIERVSAEPERWRIVTPLDFPADAAQVRSVLRTLGEGIPMEALVDEGNHEDYGVDDQNGLLVELFAAGAEVPAVAVVVGKSAAGPSSFVRIPGSEVVYRADVGGRGRYERPAADWRDKTAIELDRADVVALTLVRGDETLRFVRGPSTGVDKDGNPTPGPWTSPDAPFPVDDDGTESVVRVLSRIRAGEIHNPDYEAGFDAPRARAVLELRDGATHTVVLGGREADGASFVKVDDRPEVFRTSGQVGRMMTQPLDAFRDRALFAFQRKDVAAVRLEEGGLTIELAQSDDGTGWEITQPANMDADQKLALFTVNTLATLRAAGIAPDDSFTPAGTRFTVRFRDGRAQTLEVGQGETDADNRPVVRVRVSGKSGLYQLKQATVADLKRAFGRG